jgi:hypothetical protein
MDAEKFLEQKIGAYSAAFYDPFMARLRLLNLTNDAEQQPDIERVVTELDPAVLRGEFDAALRSIASDFVSAFNEMLGLAASREPLAARFVGRYRMRPDYQVAMEQQIRSSLTILWVAIGELAPARSAYLAYLKQQTGAVVRAGLTGASAGMLAGSFLGPVGMLVGAAVGAAIGNDVDKHGQQLLDDWNTRYKALLNAVDSSWEQLGEIVVSRFEATFGEALQRLSHDVEVEKARIAEERRRLGETRRQEAHRERAQLTEPVHSRPPVVVPSKTGERRWVMALGALALLVMCIGGSWAAVSAYSEGQDPPPVEATVGSAALAAMLPLEAGAVLRAGPAGTFAVTSTAKDAVQATILDSSVPGWMKVQTPTGETGWVSISGR